MTDYKPYPFPAIIGNSIAKKALLCVIINEDINGLLVTGTRGSAKSVLLRSAKTILEDKKVGIVPLNTTEDRLFGSIDIEKAVTRGDIGISSGILAENNFQMIVADDINLLDEKIVHGILNTSETGSVIIEREGFSKNITTHYIFAATMDPEEGGLSPQMLDRFDLCIDTDVIKDEGDRAEVIRNCLEFEKDPDKFTLKFQSDIAKIRVNIENAKERLPYVLIPGALLEIMSELCLEMNVSGQRGDIALAKVSKTLAAMDGRDDVVFEDIKEAALITLQHRRRNPPPQNESPENRSQDQNKERDDDEDHSKAENPDNSPDKKPTGNPGIDTDLQNEDEKNEEPDDNNSSQNMPSSEQIFSVGSVFEVIDYLNEKSVKKSNRDKSGNRSSVISYDSRGRYISYKNLNKKKNDIAICPSIRAAAPFQRFRTKEGLAINVKKSDLREKVREKKTGNTLLFLVDASGSMGAGKRMVSVKGAILSLLNDAYQKRDMVGLMVFRKKEATLLLPPTKSCDLAYKMLKEMPTGGRTPLSRGIIEATKLLTQGRYSKMGGSRAVIILTDGRINVSESGKNPYEELKETAKKASEEDVQFVVVDTEEGFPRIGFAKKLAFELGATYFCIDSLNKAKLRNLVKEAVYTRVL
ncbi:MAG: VWA domain-containing protein [Methanomicrobiaceae archaeon]|nr:VWA domain-containing protein [Methanomicrobiaceae archaeon]